MRRFLFKLALLGVMVVAVPALATHFYSSKAERALEELFNADGTLSIPTGESGTFEVFEVVPLQTLEPADTITVTANLQKYRVLQVEGDGGAVSLTSDPQISAGADKQVVKVVGVNETNTVTLVQGNGLSLCGVNATEYTISSGQSAEFSYDLANTRWQQIDCKETVAGEPVEPTPIEQAFNQSATGEIPNTTPNKGLILTDPLNANTRFGWYFDPSNGLVQVRPTGPQRLLLDDNSPFEVYSSDGTIAFSLHNDKRGLVIRLEDFGGRPNDDTFDNGPKLQDAINAAQDLGVSDAGYPAVVIGPGTWHFSTVVTKKSSPIICAGQVTGTSIVWNGADTATVISQDSTVPGGTSWGGIENCDFTAGTAAPETWIDFANGNSADVGLRLFNVSINGCKGDCVKVSGWWNLHAFRHNRFDACGGYCISLTTHEEQYLSTFYLRDFTWDNHQQNGALGIGGGLGFIHINNDVEANSTNAGTFVVQNGRVELNDAWTGDIAVVTVTPNTATSSPGIKKVVFRDVTVQDVILDTGDVLLRSASASALGIGLENVIVAQLDDLHEGLTNCDATTYSVFPHSGRITDYHCGSEFVEFAYGALRVRVPTTPGSADTGLQVFIGAETVPRFQVNNAGRLSFGDGTNAVDTQLYRAAANRLETGTSDDFRSAARLASTSQTATCADSGDGNPSTLSLQPTASVVKIVNSDAHGCTVTMSESSTLDGAIVWIVVTSNAGGTVNFADTSGVSELTGALTLAVTDTLTLVYTNSAWHQIGTSNN